MIEAKDKRKVASNRSSSSSSQLTGLQFMNRTVIGLPRNRHIPNGYWYSTIT